MRPPLMLRGCINVCKHSIYGHRQDLQVRATEQPRARVVQRDADESERDGAVLTAQGTPTHLQFT